MSRTSAIAGPAVGIAVAGKGIKGAPVDLSAGQCEADRARLLTPSPATPDAVASVVDTVLELLCTNGPVGITLPAVLRDGVVETAWNGTSDADPRWIGVPAVDLFARATGRVVEVVNEADAAGIAEMRYGAGKDRSGVVVVITLDTGIGSAVFLDGRLVPNTELGHMPPHQGWSRESLDDEPSWNHYADQLQHYLELVEGVLWPRLIILGGSVSKHADRFLPRLHLRTEIVPARLGQDAGLVGAALTATGGRVPIPRANLDTSTVDYD
jgi:polyphosphate glucokinase